MDAAVAHLCANRPERREVLDEDVARLSRSSTPTSTACAATVSAPPSHAMAASGPFHAPDTDGLDGLDGLDEDGPSGSDSLPRGGLDDQRQSDRRNTQLMRGGAGSFVRAVGGVRTRTAPGSVGIVRIDHWTGHARGPLVGGVIVQNLIWQWIFWINVPIAAVLIPLVLVRLERNAGSPRGLDYVGIGLVSAAAFGLVWGVIRGNESGWASAEIVAALSGCAIALVVFVGWELRADAPRVTGAEPGRESRRGHGP